MDSRKQCFDTYIFNLRPKFLAWFVIRVKVIDVIKNRRKTSFVAHILLTKVLVVLKICRLLVDMIVSQVHAQVVHVVKVGTLVSLRRKAD